MISILIIIAITWIIGAQSWKPNVQPASFVLTLDQYKLIVQHNMDGGDTAGREGDYWFYIGLLKLLTYRNLDDVVNNLQVSKGIWIRNPKQNPVVPPAKSWNDPSDFSADQEQAIIIGLGACNRKSLVFDLLIEHIKRFGFYQNRDLPRLNEVGTYSRALSAWYLYPLIWVSDITLIVNSIIRLFASTTDTSNDVNHTLLLLQAQYKYPTPVSWIARNIYKHRQTGIQGVWDNYFNSESGANPFNEIYRDLISRM